MYLNFFLAHPKDDSVLCNEKITCNLDKMAAEAGVYKALWQPYENGYSYGRDVVGILGKGLKNLRDKPDYYKQFEPQDEQGAYGYLVCFVNKVLEACLNFPDAVIAQRQTEA